MLDHEEFDPDDLLLDPDDHDVSEDTDDYDEREPVEELAFSEDQRILSDSDVPLAIEGEEEEEAEEAAAEPAE